MIVAFAPIVALLLGVTDIVVPWETLLLSVVLYVVIPLVAGAIARRQVIRSHDGNEAAVDAFTARLKPWSIIGLLATVVLLRSEEHTSELQSLMRLSSAVFFLK